MGVRGGMNLGAVDLFRLRNALEKQNHRAAHGGNVDGLVGCIQDQNGLLHEGGAARGERGKVPASQIPRSVGRKHATRFGGVSPPEVHRLWSSSAHRKR